MEKLTGNSTLLSLTLSTLSSPSTLTPLAPPRTAHLTQLGHGAFHTIFVCFLNSVLPAFGALSSSLPTRRLAVSLIAILGLWSVFFATSGELRKDDLLGNTVGAALLWTHDLLIIHQPQRDFWKVGEQKYVDLPRHQRVGWALDLVHNYFGVGWNWENRSAHPPHPSDEQSRFRFAAYELGRFLMANLMVDLTSTLWRKRTAVHLGGSIMQDGPFWLAVYVMAWHVDLAFRMIRGHAVIHCVLTGLGLEKPSNAPNQFGGVRYAWSVRKFWGKAWHDQFRRFLTTNSQYLTRTVLGLSKPSTFRTYLELHLVFLLSGLVHWLGTYAMLREWRGPGLTVLYFLLQASVITLEDQLLALGKLAGIKDSRLIRLIGYAWVLGWTMALLPLRAEPIVRAGYLDHGGAKEFSVVQGVWEGKWWAEFERVTS